MHIIKLLLFIIVILFSSSSNAWEAHSLLTFLILQKMPDLSSKPKVPAETLESFLKKEQTGLIKLLEENEAWSRQHLQDYPPLPSTLTFQSLLQQKKPIKLAWMESIRINPTLLFPLYVERFPGISYPQREILSRSQVMLPWLANETSLRINSPLIKIKPNDKLAPLQIIASAANEPDYGLDMELWQENKTWFSDLYQWGPQPFGNAKVRKSSQGPFHMGFYYEPSIFYAANPKLKHSYLEYRIHLYLSLAKYAFKTHHPYWGYRFLGWAIHYLQDLSQPYHSTALPNVSLFKTFTAHILSMLHKPVTETNLIQLVTNKHYAFENYVYFQLLAATQQKNINNPFIKALTDQHQDKQYPEYYDLYPRLIVAKESHEEANYVDETLLHTFQNLYVTDPNYLFYITDPSINLVTQTKNTDSKNLNSEIIRIFKSLGSHTRKMVKYAIARDGVKEENRSPP